MALSGIQIYKLLPQTNCKECGFPTCLAFAMKLAAKQVELSSCPYVTEAAKAQLEESSAPPIRLISLKSDGHEVKAGNEVVLFRHEKTFYNPTGLFVKILSDGSPDKIKQSAEQIEQYKVNYVGIDLGVDGIAVDDVSGSPEQFSASIQAIRSVSKKPLLLVSKNSASLEAGLDLLGGENVMIYAPGDENWETQADLAAKHQANLVISGSSLDQLAEITEKCKSKGLENLVLEASGKNFSESLILQTQIRRLALKSNFRPLGFPTIVFCQDATRSAHAVAKYAGFIVLESFSPEWIYPLLVLRQNIYTDPQKPIQVQPGVYEINNPKPEDPVLVTTNFSITYFSVANEVEGSGNPAWLVVADAEGMSVLTAWAAGKFDAERIAKSVKGNQLDEKISRKRLVIPGAVAVLSGEVEAELPDWEIRVGPREAVDIPKFMKQAL